MDLSLSPTDVARIAELTELLVRPPAAAGLPAWRMEAVRRLALILGLAEDTLSLSPLPAPAFLAPGSRPRELTSRQQAILELLRPMLASGFRRLPHGMEAPLPSPDVLAVRLGLTPRQAEVALLLARRMSNKEIARTLAISPFTARNHTDRVLRRMGVATRQEVVLAVRRATELSATEHPTP